MRVPDPPELRPIDRVSPSLYETLLGCGARAVWYVHGERDVLAPHPLALLGTCFHSVMEAVQHGEISGEPEERRAAARGYFDAAATRLHEHAHPLLRVKFSTPERLPFYNLF